MKRILVVIGIAVSTLSWSQYVSVWSVAKGNKPETVSDSKVFQTLGDWANNHYYAETSAHADADTWDPPGCESSVSNSFLQDQAHDAVLRASGVSRMIYRGRYSNEVNGLSQIKLKYALRVENLANTELNIVFGNDLHGVFGTNGYGSFTLVESIHIPGIIEYGTGRINYSSSVGLLTQDGLLANSTTTEVLTDPWYGPSVEGFKTHSFQFYGSQVFAPGSVTNFDCYQSFEFFAGISYVDGSYGLAMFDFSNTAHLTVKAYDPITGADRSSEISVTLLPTPETLAPTAEQILLGTQGSGGNLTSWASNDGDLRQVCKFFVPNLNSPFVSVNLSFTTTKSNASAVKLVTRVASKTGGAQQLTLRVKNQVTNAFDLTNINGTTIGTLPFEAVGVVPGPASDYIGNSGAMVGNIQVKALGFQTVSFPCVGFDSANMVVSD